MRSVNASLNPYNAGERASLWRLARDKQHDCGLLTILACSLPGPERWAIEDRTVGLDLARLSSMLITRQNLKRKLKSIRATVPTNLGGHVSPLTWAWVVRSTEKSFDSSVPPLSEVSASFHFHSQRVTQQTLMNVKHLEYQTKSIKVSDASTIVESPMPPKYYFSVHPSFHLIILPWPTLGPL